MIKQYDNVELWWVTGAQLLYGGDAVVAVDGHSKEMVEGLNASGNIPVKIVYKGTANSSKEVEAVVFKKLKFRDDAQLETDSVAKHPAYVSRHSVDFFNDFFLVFLFGAENAQIDACVCHIRRNRDFCHGKHHALCFYFALEDFAKLFLNEL